MLLEGCFVDKIEDIRNDSFSVGGGGGEGDSGGEKRGGNEYHADYERDDPSTQFGKL